MIVLLGTAKHDEQYFNLDDHVMRINMFWLLNIYSKICFNIDDHVMRINMIR